ncbi:MAG TPA: hypothetical protein QGG59_04980 [Planctomycetota bacterium]|jgi:hypothetical protein|nr:hypothetical protein [Planctomycetota bacterium]MDP6129040.1 hypothetical protein [Planctomycetota bacterium]MDP7245174.1 hypothetical protein [Planctomycetota bacterium]HJM39451.1 hypothetical protein [Planctomycetota bacterium]|tara:strand:+ start:1127 stop:1957 length:831 start_codon:yes stop_codon:yes gene_type:complete
MHHRFAPIFPALFLLVGSFPLFAQETNDVAVWVEKMAECTSQPVSYDFSLKFDMEGMGMSVASSGSILMQDKRHLRMTSQTTVKAAQMPTGEQNMKQEMIMDGATMWTVTTMDHPVNRGEKITSISRMTIELMEKVGAQATGLPGVSNSTDMASQIRTMFEQFYTDCELSISNGLVKISGNISEEFMDSLPMGGLELSRFKAELDEKTAFPLQIAMGTDKKDFIKMSMSNPKFLDPKKIDQDLFRYTPDPGASVMDMDAMLQSMGKAEEGSSESEL